MKPGKIPESVLKRSVLKQLKLNREEVLVGPEKGHDFAAIKMQEEICVFSMDPVIGSTEDAGIRAVHAAINNLVVAGAEPIGILNTILLPEEYKEKHLKQLMREISQVCQNLNIHILGGHTETTRAVNQVVVTVTAVGKMLESPLSIRHAKPEQDIIMVKYAAMEGTAIIAREKESELRTRYSRDFIQNAKDLLDEMSVLKEALIAKNYGVSAMHDVRNGGVYGALWELASAADIGILVNLDMIPVRQETVEICEFYDLNPYKLLSGGSLLIVAARGHDLAERLKAAGLPAVVIGKTTKEQNKKIIREGEAGFLEPPKSDDLYKVL